MEQQRNIMENLVNNELFRGEKVYYVLICILYTNALVKIVNGIQEVSGSIPLISTKNVENHWFSTLFSFSLNFLTDF